MIAMTMTHVDVAGGDGAGARRSVRRAPRRLNQGPAYGRIRIRRPGGFSFHRLERLKVHQGRAVINGLLDLDAASVSSSISPNRLRP
jgi:hypothetical protein